MSTHYMKFDEAKESSFPNSPVMGGVSDPYTAARSAITRDVQKLTNDFDEWNTLLETTNTAQSPAFGRLTQSLKHQLKQVKTMVEEVEQTISAVEANRGRFSHISDDELKRRRKFVNEMRVVLTDCKSTVKSKRTKQKVEADKRKLMKIRRSTQSIENEQKQQNESNLGSHQQKMDMMEGKEDEMLDDMAQIVQRLNVMGDAINIELDEQAELIRETEEDMDAAKNKLDILFEKVDKLLRNSDACRCCTVIILLGILCVICVFAFQE